MALGLTQTMDNHRSGLAALLPIIAMVFLPYLVIGMAMPILPLYVHQRLGLGPFMVGLVTGSQFAASLFTRMWAGNFTDRRGVKHSVIIGLLIAASSGAFYAGSLFFTQRPTVAISVLLAGRILLGTGESFIITGALSWGLALMGSENTGKVMAFIGTSLYAGFAVGAPLGTVLYDHFGFLAIGAATMLGALAALLLVRLLRAVPPKPHVRASFAAIARVVWVPGLGVALSGVGFAAVTTFISLLYAAHGWDLAWLTFTALSVAFIAGRLAFGHLPDKLGGAQVALVCIVVETLAQLLIWHAASPWQALAGAALTGLGYSLVYPAFGVVAIKQAPAENRGMAMGAYTSFLDLSLGFSGPLLGLVAGRSGLNAIFLASALVVLSSAFVAAWLIFGRPATAQAAIT